MPLQPTGSSLYVSRPLTNVSVAFQNSPLGEDFIAARAFPIVDVQRQGDLYWKYKKGDWFRGQAEKRAPATESAGSGWEVETDSYFADVFALHKDVADQDRANAASTWDLDRDAAEFVTQNLLLKRETLFHSTFMTTSVWTGATGIGGGANGADLTGAAAAGSNQFVQWDRSGSDPIRDIRTQSYGMARRTGYRPNTLVLGPLTYAALLDNTAVIERIKYSERAVVGADLLATLFDVQQVLVSWGVQNTANQGATDAIDFVAGKTALLMYSAPRAGLRTPSAGYIFAWAGFLGAGAYGTRVKRFRMEPIESDRIEAEMAFDMKVVSPELGVFFNSAVQ